MSILQYFVYEIDTRLSSWMDFLIEISLYKCPKSFLTFMASKFTILSSPFIGNPEDIVAIGKLLHFVSFLLNELLPVNTFYLYMVVVDSA